MTPNAFIGRSQAPTDEDLNAALGAGVSQVWNDVLAMLAGEHGIDTCEWHSYSPKAGWSIRARKGKRNIVYLVPCSGCIRAAFILGAKAMTAARETKWPKLVSTALEGATKYPEGFGVTFEFKSGREVPALSRLAAIKIAH